MKKFLTGSIRNFIALLLVFTGIKLWRDELVGLALVCFAGLAALIVWQVIKFQDRNRNPEE